MRMPLVALLFLAACAASGPLTQPNDREWNLLTADYQWPADAARCAGEAGRDGIAQDRIQTHLSNLKPVDVGHNR